jgi:hypothetical protein
MIRSQEPAFAIIQRSVGRVSTRGFCFSIQRIKSRGASPALQNKKRIRNIF